jgi:hypothetical protein
MNIHNQSRVNLGASYSQEMRASGQNSRKTRSRLPVGLNVPVWQCLLLFRGYPRQLLDCMECETEKHGALIVVRGSSDLITNL